MNIFFGEGFRLSKSTPGHGELLRLARQLSIFTRLQPAFGVQGGSARAISRLRWGYIPNSMVLIYNYAYQHYGCITYLHVYHLFIYY